MITFDQYEVWFVTGSQHLYGPETLKQVAANTERIVSQFNADDRIPVKVVWTPTVKTAAEIDAVCREANNSAACIGLICWMHTFSPAKMWIQGLTHLAKPFVHLHTQFNREIPWADIDMDFMNLNQSAHGDREFGFMTTRMRLNRKVITGHWQDAATVTDIAAWMRVAAAWEDSQQLRVARFGDNMRDVAVTEGDKVAGQMQLGYSVHGFGIGDLATLVQQVTETDIDTLAAEYMEQYSVSPEVQKTRLFSDLREAARIELGVRQFLVQGDFKAFTTTFEDLHGIVQLPGLACQRLMAEGYGFGAEGDWKTAALVRAMKIMGHGMPGGATFMEDYTYHLPENGPGCVLGAHMLEVCPSIAAQRPSLEIHPLSIGGKADPARLVFDTKPGPAINATLVDLGNRFRMILNPVDVIEAEAALPKLPVARAFWKPLPDLQTSATAWIYAGGAHHTGFSQAVTIEQMQDFAEIAGVECIVIDQDTRIDQFKKELRYNHVYYSLANGF
jgi:L-arabinose isomerase